MQVTYSHTIPEKTIIIPSETITGTIEVPDPEPCPTVPPVQDITSPFIANLLGVIAPLYMEGDVTDKLRAALQTGKIILMNDGNGIISETIMLPGGTRIEGSGDTRNHGAITGAAFVSKVTGSETINGKSFLKPCFTTNPNVSAGGMLLRGFCINGTGSNNPLLREFGTGNGSFHEGLRLVGGGRAKLQLFDAATDHSAAYYGRFVNIFADGGACLFCEIDAGAVKGGRGPIYVVFEGACDVQSTVGADFEIRNGQGDAATDGTMSVIGVRDSVFHGGPAVHMKLVNCPQVRVRHDNVITTSPVVMQSDKPELRGLITALQFGANFRSGYIVKKPGTQKPITDAMNGYLANYEVVV